jgi:hypothetical protein
MKKIGNELPILRTRIKEVELIIKHTILQLKTNWYTDEEIETMIAWLETTNENI